MSETGGLCTEYGTVWDGYAQAVLKGLLISRPTQGYDDAWCDGLVELARKLADKMMEIRPEEMGGGPCV